MNVDKVMLCVSPYDRQPPVVWKMPAPLPMGKLDVHAIEACNNKAKEHLSGYQAGRWWLEDEWGRTLVKSTDRFRYNPRTWELII